MTPENRGVLQGGGWRSLTVTVTRPTAGWTATSDQPWLVVIKGADQHCQMLAEAVGVGDRTWRAYLSTLTV